MPFKTPVITKNTSQKWGIIRKQILKQQPQEVKESFTRANALTIKCDKTLKQGIKKADTLSIGSLLRG